MSSRILYMCDESSVVFYRVNCLRQKVQRKRAWRHYLNKRKIQQELSLKFMLRYVVKFNK